MARSSSGDGRWSRRDCQRTPIACIWRHGSGSANNGQASRGGSPGASVRRAGPGAVPVSPAAAYSCNNAAHRAFDFRVGRWNACVSGTNDLAGRSAIEAVDAGCVITGHWTSFAGPAFSGRSLTAFDATTGKWVQVCMDSGGEIARYEVGPSPGGMALAAPDKTTPCQPGKAHLRMTFTANSHGTVRQVGERRLDHCV